MSYVNKKTDGGGGGGGILVSVTLGSPCISGRKEKREIQEEGEKEMDLLCKFLFGGVAPPNFCQSSPLGNNFLSLSSTDQEPLDYNKQVIILYILVTGTKICGACLLICYSIHRTPLLQNVIPCTHFFFYSVVTHIPHEKKKARSN